MTTKAPLIVLHPEQKSLSELLRDVVQSRSATAARISQYERHVEEHTKQARYYTEKARTLKTDLAKMDAYLTEAWTEYASSSTQLRHPKPKASRKAKSKYHGNPTHDAAMTA